MPLRTGQPLAGPLELTVGGSTIARPSTGDETKALEVPSHQVRGELRVRLFERAEIAGIYERAIGGATKLDPTQADVESGQPYGGGAALRYSIAPRGEPWSVGIDTELMGWTVPYTELRTCIENCEGVDPQQTIRSTSGELTWGFGVTPAYRVDDRITLFGGFFLRNHPTITRKDEELFEHNDEDTTMGPTNFLMHAGAAVKLGAFTALLLVQQNVDGDPVRYGPGIGFALSASIDPGKLPAPASAEPAEDKIAEARARMYRARARRGR